MTPRPIDNEEGAAKKDLLAISFNQDCSSLSVGHDDGYALYSLRALDHLEKVHEGKSPQRVYVVERLFGSSLITLVSMEQSRKLSVYHYQKNNEICSHGYSSAILSVRLNRKRVVVCLEESIHVHNIMDMRLLHVIKDTPANPLGLVDLSADENNCYLAYPGSSSTGHVHIFDAESLTAACGFAAHDGPLAAMAFNPDGKKLATASQEGDGHSGFTRGMKRCVTIHSLAFNADSTLLCSSSNTETIHVFSMVRTEPAVEAQKSEEQQDSLGSWVNYFSAQASNYLPTHMNELMLREKSFCTARLPMAGTKTVVGLPKIGDKHYLVAATSDGYLFFYTLESGGNECALVRQFRIGATRAAPFPLGTTTMGNVNTRAGAQSHLIDFEDSARGGGGDHAEEPPRRSPTNSTGSHPPKQSTPPSTGSTPPDRQRRTSQSVPPFASSPANSSGTSSSGGGNAGGDHPPAAKPPNRPSRPPQLTDADETDESDNDGIGSPADLDDLDEFPPLGGM
ncbi:WD repeat domain phosphoinositide-interacting protein 2-like protein [Aphelenchoides fujianensis]|nr:WD repeat domain phosphoinositide-interacting protein 2-like protein [Aphelenchoides fujianensis]